MHSTFNSFQSLSTFSIGAALLWVAQGAHIAKCSREYELKYRLTIGSTTGYFMGLFWGWEVLNNFVGNSIAAALFYADTTTTTVYVIFSIINVGGVFLFLLIRSFPVRPALFVANQPQQTHEQSVDIAIAGVQSQLMEDGDLSEGLLVVSDIETIPCTADQSAKKDEIAGVSVFSMVSLWATKQQLMLIPLTLYSGMSQSFIAGNFPAMIEDNFHKFGALTVFGAVDAVCCVLFGSFSDRVGKLPVLKIAFVAHGTVFVYFWLYWSSNGNLDPLHSDTLQRDWYVFCTMAVFLGVGDAGFNTQLYTLYEILLGKETEVFANLQFWKSLAMTWGFASSGIDLSWHIVVCSSFVLMVCAVIPLYLSAEVRSKSQPRWTL